MYVQNIGLKNIACFDDVWLDFTQQGEVCHWNVLLGENGTGKSTVLQMLAVSLLGRDFISTIAPRVQWRDYVSSNKGKDMGQIEAHFLSTQSDKRPQEEKQHYATAFMIGNVKTGLEQYKEHNREDYTALDATLYGEDAEIGWFACGYGPWRKLIPYTGDFVALRETIKKPYRFATLFDAHVSMTDVHNWLVSLEFRHLKEPDNERAMQIHRLAIQALEQVLGTIRVKEITTEGVWVEEQYGATVVSLDSLSDSYRSMAAWVGDLVRRLIHAFPNMENPLHAEGVVLVDEIDIHLHPRWQRSVVEQIRVLFPNLQFIVSSHSPFIAQDMHPEDNIIVLSKHDGQVVATKEQGFAKSWRADQILTSSLFGLETTRDVTIAHMEKEYQYLLDRKVSSTLTDENRFRLQELKQWLDQKKSPPWEHADEQALYDAAQTFMDVLDDYIS